MKYSIAFASEVDSWKWVKRAEELGFHAAWFYDTQLLNPDVFICMALAAHETSRIRLGTGVLVPSNRIEPVAANALASLNRLAPGESQIIFDGTPAELDSTRDRRVQQFINGEAGERLMEMRGENPAEATETSHGSPS